MKKSKFLQQVGDGDNRLYYHSLFGNLFLLEKSYIEVLEDKDPSRFIGQKDDIISELMELLSCGGKHRGKIDFSGTEQETFG